MESLLLIGGSNIDIKAKANKKIIFQDSNIGDISYSFGGVSRNIAEDLSYLEDTFTFLTSVGNDINGKKIQANLKSLNISTKYIESKEQTGTYLSIDNDNGEMQVAICQNKIMDKMKKEALYPFASLLENHDLIFLDANLSESCIDYILKSANKKIIVEGVSTSKIIRFKNHLNKIYLLKCNLLEAQYLMNKKEATAIELCKGMLSCGLKNACITNGFHDIVAMQDGNIFSIPVLKENDVISTTGCGDAFCAGILYSLRRDCDLKRACLFAKEISSITLKSLSPCTPLIKEALRNYEVK